MPGHAKSEAAKHLNQLHKAEAQETHAVAEYNKQLETYLHLGGKKPSYCGVTRHFNIDYHLLQCQVLNIGTSKAKSNAQKAHLSETEATELIDFAIEMAYQAFPLTLACLEKYAAEQASTCKPNFKHFSKNWASHFMIKYCHHISTKWGVCLNYI